MVRNIRSDFKVGLIHFMSYPDWTSSPERAEQTIYQTLADDYFDAVELTHIGDESLRAKVRAWIEQSGITACYGAQPRLMGAGLNANDLNEEGRLKAVAILKDSVDEAAYLGCKGVAFLAGKWQEETKEQSWEQLCKTTSEICVYAAERGLMVELEVFDYDVDKASLIGPAPYAVRFAEEMRSRHENFGLLVDLSHLPLTRENSRYALKLMSPYITHLHIGNAVVKPDCDAYGDMHPRFGFPNSANDVAELADFLQNCIREGLNGGKDPMVLSFEVKPWKDEDPGMVLANAKRCLNKAWAMVE